jgi:hypothetical protein
VIDGFVIWKHSLSVTATKSHGILNNFSYLLGLWQKYCLVIILSFRLGILSMKDCPNRGLIGPSGLRAL